MTLGSWIMDDLRAHRRRCSSCDARITEATERPFWIPLDELCCEAGRSLYRAWWEWAFELRYPRDATEAASVPKREDV